MKKAFLYLLLLYYEVEKLFLRFVCPKRRDGTLILRTDNIGDFVLWLSSAERLRQSLSGRITLVCSPAVKEIAQATGLFDEIVTLSDKKFVLNPLYRFRILLSLRAKRYSLILNPVYARDYFVGDSLVRNIKAEKKIGFGENYRNTMTKFKKYIASSQEQTRLSERLLRRADGFYDQILPAKEGTVMELRRNTEFVSRLLGADFETTLPKWRFELPKSDIDGDYIALFVGASQIEKNLGGAKFTKIVNTLNQKVVLCGGKGDLEIAEAILEGVNQRERVVNMVGKTSLLELFALIGSARMVISNDSAASHIAPLMRVPSVVILPEVFRARFHPYDTDDRDAETRDCFPRVVRLDMPCHDCGGACTHRDEKTGRWKCIEGISVDMIMCEVEKILGR